MAAEKPVQKHGVWDPDTNRFYQAKSAHQADQIRLSLNMERRRGGMRQGKRELTKNHLRKPGEKIPSGAAVTGLPQTGSRIGHWLVDLILGKGKSR